MLKKEQVIKIIKDQLPDEFSMDELFERMSFIEHVQKGLKDSEEGRTISEEDLDKEIAE
ncbi:MAG: hypothetical protein ACK5UE_07310 [Chitinophagales bacterium]|jgi:hypothetical protein|nr:hypothetical protein [Sphingobacteriales bacterium]